MFLVCTKQVVDYQASNYMKEGKTINSEHCL